tara:strand:- start:2240 stop:2467 length:228 start_codon:yes stop_codon:yes gene_type:complete
MGAQPRMSRRMTAIKSTMIWIKLTDKERMTVMGDVESGQDFGNFKLNTRTVIVKAERELEKYKNERMRKMTKVQR